MIDMSTGKKRGAKWTYLHLGDDLVELALGHGVLLHRLLKSGEARKREGSGAGQS